MLDTTVTLLLVVAAIILFIVWKQTTRKQYRLPPGPKGAFIFGHALRPWMTVDYISEVGKAYRDIFTLSVLGQPVVVVKSMESIKEAYGKDCVAGRTQSAFVRQFAGGYGILWSQGERWRTHRRFTLSVLRDFGFGKSKIELTIQDELQDLRESIRAMNGSPFAPHKLYIKAVSNVINSIVFDERFSENPEFECMMQYVRDIAEMKPQALYFFFFWPIIKHLEKDITGLKKIDHARVGIHQYIAKRIKQHRETFNPLNIRDYIDSFLLESQNKDGANSFIDDQLEQTIFDLFNAGTETTTTNLLWSSVLLAQNPKVQQKMFEEIERTIGLSKLPDTSDRSKMPYVDAVLHEILRYCPIVPHGIAHAAMDETQLCGYEIPADCVVVSDLWSSNRDSKLWKDPYNFNPENFLDSDGKLVNTNNMLSFGAGRRVCLGEALARQEVFIFITGLLQHFEFVEDRNQPLPLAEETDKTKIIFEPGHYEIILKIR